MSTSEEYAQALRDLERANRKLELATDGLRQIANADYRGPEPHERYIARTTLRSIARVKS